MIKRIIKHIKNHKSWYSISVIVILFIISIFAYYRMPAFDDLTSGLTGYVGRYDHSIGRITQDIQILTPRFGDIYIIEEKINIQWKVSSASGISQPSQSYRFLRKPYSTSTIYLLPKRGSSTIIAKKVSDTSYLWHIPSNLSGEFRIGIIDSLKRRGIMSGYFTIKKRPVTVPRCTQNDWNCTEFEPIECPDSGQRTRTCTLTNQNCTNPYAVRPTEVETCEPIQTEPPCYDNESCQSNEICLNGSCTEAPLTIVYINNALEPLRFDEMIQEQITLFTSITPLSNCSDQVRVHKLNACCGPNEEIATCAERYVPEFDVAILIHPLGVFEEGCSAISFSYRSVIIGDSFKHVKTFVHEMGHVIGGFADQYCLGATFNASPAINPISDEEGCGYSSTKRKFTCPVEGKCWNRETGEHITLITGACESNQYCEDEFGMDWECISCWPATENYTPWYFSYCPSISNHVPPVICEGNPTLSGFRSVMGSPAYDEIEFDANEYSILEQKLICR